MTPTRLAIVAAVVAALALSGIVAPTATAQQPPVAPPPGMPAEPGVPEQPLPPRPPAPVEEEPPPPVVEVPAEERPTMVPEEVIPSEGLAIQVPAITVGDANLFIPPAPRGRLQITPSVTLSGEWNDNVRKRAVDRRTDYILGVTPGVTLRVQQPQYRILAGYNTSAQFFLRDTEDDRLGRRHRLFADVLYQFDPRLSFRLTERFVFDRNTDVVTVSGLSAGRRDAYRNTITPAMRWQATHLTALEASVSYTLLRFDATEGVRDGIDSDTYRVAVGADHRFTPRLSGTADFGVGYFNVEREPEAFTYTPRAGLTYRFTPRLRGFLAGGPTLLHRDGDITVSPALAAGLDHLYRWGTVRVGYERAIAADGIGVADRQTALAAVRVLTLMRGLRLELLTRYTMAEVERRGREEDREALAVNLRLVYRLTATISAIGAYTYFRQTSDRRDREFDQNRVFLGLQYAYPITFE